jgi:dihydrolipoamide dehydrogenase
MRGESKNIHSMPGLKPPKSLKSSSSKSHSVKVVKPKASNPEKPSKNLNSKSSSKFDLIVVGGGFGGMEAAYGAIKKGLKTALIEPNFFGGVCLNTGCIPTKTLLRSAELSTDILRAGEFGINAPQVSVDFSKIMERAKGIIGDSRKSIELSLNNNNLTIFKDHASFVGERKINVGSEVIEGSRIIIATGSKPHVPPINGLEGVDYFVSGTQENSEKDILSLKQLPETIVIIGGGYIGFEFASFFHALKTKVIILEGMDSVLGVLDEEIRELLLKKYQGDDFQILTGVKIKGISQNENIKEIKFTDSQGKENSVSGDVLFVATGRTPSTSDLNLEKAGVKVDKRGAIIVDENLETNKKGIYAIGDVTGKYMFAHTAKREGHIAFQNSVSSSGKSKKKFKVNAIPWSVFTAPPVSGVGITENKNGKLGVMKAYFSRAQRAKIIGDSDGLLKVWFEKKSKKIVGAELMGLNSDDLIGEFSALIVCGGTIEDLREIIHGHPTLSEVGDALKEEKIEGKKSAKKK